MKKLKSVSIWMFKIIIVTVLIIGIITAGFLFKNKAPIITGNVKFGIQYKKGLKLDIYAPTKTIFKKSPVVLYIHGGAWVIGNKLAINYNRFNESIRQLRENGYTIISPNYTLGRKGRSPFPDCILDIYDAIDWTKNNAEHYNLDIKNIGLFGESAGAHIAMMVAFSDLTLKNKHYKKPHINFLIDIYGPSDLINMYNGTVIQNINDRLNHLLKITKKKIFIEDYIFGFNPESNNTKTKAILEKYSPLNFLAKNNFPTLIIHGNKDQMVPVEQSIALKLKMDSIGNTSEMYIIEGMHHSLRNADQIQKNDIQTSIIDFVLKSYEKDDSNNKNSTITRL